MEPEFETCVAGGVAGDLYTPKLVAGVRHEAVELMMSDDMFDISLRTKPEGFKMS